VDIELFISVISGERVMSKKVKQEHFDNFVQEVAGVVSILGGDLMKVQLILYNLLDEMGKIEKPICVSCKESLMIPVVKNIEKSDDCPNCGENIYGKGTTTFENWDEGQDGEEE
jgi:predicted RNA-binding Zn-ribbon protein involved in translation (DUF1610 family)